MNWSPRKPTPAEFEYLGPLVTTNDAMRWSRSYYRSLHQLHLVRLFTCWFDPTDSVKDVLKQFRPGFNLWIAIQHARSNVKESECCRYVDLFYGLLNHEDRKIRIGALDLMAQFGRSTAETRLHEIIAEGGPLKDQALLLLGCVGGKQSLAILDKAIEQKRWPLRTLLMSIRNNLASRLESRIENRVPPK